MKKKVIFFINSILGGAERVAITISKIYISQGHDVIYYLSGPANELEAFLPQNAKVVYHKVPTFTQGLISLMKTAIKDVKPDYVFGTGMPLNWRLVLAVLTSKYKPKIILRNENYIYTCSFVQKLRLRFTYPFAKYIVAQTDEMKSGIINSLGVSKRKVITISNPIDRTYIDEKLKEPALYEKSTNKITYVATGRMHPVKGYDLLIKAFAKVLKRQSNSQLFIVGNYDANNDFYKSLQDLIDSLGINQYITFTGFTTNPYVYMANADCFVLSSRNEGLPNVMLEAMYCGTPVAAFKCIPVIERLVDEGKTGYLAECENVEQLVEAMLKTPKLGRIVSTYAGNTGEQFIKLLD